MIEGPLRIGILGAARVAVYAVIAPARAQPRAQVVAVAARDPARARDYAATHGIPRVHADYAALCADPEVDLVYVATPPSHHLEHARLAFAAGKPALVEKPFTMDASEAAALLDAADAAGVAVFEAMHSRHHLLWRRIAELLPELGRLRSIDAVFDAQISTAAEEFRWDAGLGGGALMDLGVYPLAWTRAVGGEPLAARDVRFERRRGADAAVSATLDLPDGVTARVASSMVAPFRAALEVVGDGGRLRVHNPLAPQRGGTLTLTTPGGKVGEIVDGPGTYDAQLAAVVATSLDGARFPLPPRDPLASMAAIDMVRAGATGDARGEQP